MKSPATRKFKNRLANCCPEFLDPSQVAFEVGAVENDQHTGCRCRRFGTPQSAVESPVIETEVVSAPLLELPAVQRCEEIARLVQIRYRNLDVIDSRLFTHNVVSSSSWPIALRKPALSAGDTMILRFLP